MMFAICLSNTISILPSFCASSASKHFRASVLAMKVLCRSAFLRIHGAEGDGNKTSLSHRYIANNGSSSYQLFPLDAHTLGGGYLKIKEPLTPKHKKMEKIRMVVNAIASRVEEEKKMGLEEGRPIRKGCVYWSKKLGYTATFISLASFYEPHFPLKKRKRWPSLTKKISQ